MCAPSSPLVFLSPLLISYVAAFVVAALAALVKNAKPRTQAKRAFSRRDVLRSVETWRSIWRACLLEGFFMGNVGFAIWALVGPIEGHPYKPEVQAGALVLLIASCALYPFVKVWRRRGKHIVMAILGVLAMYILLRQRL